RGVLPLSTGVTEARSERIARFERDALADPAGATAALVADLAAAQGPLVEPLGPDEVLLTFVYAGPGEQVHLYGNMVITLTLDGVPMTHVPGTDVWHRTVRTTELDLCVSYCFLVDQPPLVAEAAISTARDEELYNAQLVSLASSSVADPHNPD